MNLTALPAPWRLVAASAGAVFLTMFLPWYSRDTSAVIGQKLQRVTANLSAWQAFSFVEAAVLLVVVGVLALLVSRAQGKAFHLPGGDGTVVAAAGLWVCFLVFYRQLDKPSGSGNAQIGTTYGVTWGIFVTFLAGAGMAYAGFRLRQARLGEPALPGDPDPTDRPVRRRDRSEDLTRVRDERPRPAFDEAPTSVAPRPRPRDRAEGWLGREGAVRDLGGAGASPRPEPPTTRQPTRRRPSDDDADDQPQLPFDD